MLLSSSSRDSPADENKDVDKEVVVAGEEYVTWPEREAPRSSKIDKGEVEVEEEDDDEEGEEEAAWATESFPLLILVLQGTKRGGRVNLAPFLSSRSYSELVSGERCGEDLAE